MADAAVVDTDNDSSSPGPGGSILNRELSSLDFNARVLALAADPNVPLLERAKFLAIFSQSLDEFFQVRVAGLKDQVAAGITTSTPDGRTPAQQLIEIRQGVEALVTRADDIFLHDLTPALAEQGIVFSTWAQLDDDDRKELNRLFEQRVFPVLTPLAVDPGHPFPWISELSLNLAVTLRETVSGPHRFARVKVPTNLPRFVVTPDGERFVPLEEVIAAHLGQLFLGMEIEHHATFRVSRNADLTLEDEEADDLLDAVEMELRNRRRRLPVRLELDAHATDEVRLFLCRQLELAEDDLYVTHGPLDLRGLWAVHDLDRPDLEYRSYPAVVPAGWAEENERRDVFELLRQTDVLVHHPYESFSATTEEFVRQAAADPDVLAIKVTLYRTATPSKIVAALIDAAEAGKEVAAAVEVKARGDEWANVRWARELEEAGVHVVYGVVQLKTHAKVVLVVRAEPDGIRRYCHVGTGNYNHITARIYEDLGLLTADPDLGDDLTHLFNSLTGYGRDMRYRRILVAPAALRAALLSLIRNESAAGVGHGRIVAKMNSLVDAELIEALYEASQAGVEIDLIVRGICCLRPGVPGLSERIRVRSLVGRYLEHSRIYYFANGRGRGQPAFYTGSADLMPRNLDRRVEVLIPVESPDGQDRLWEILEVNLADDRLAWELGSDAVWRRVAGDRADGAGVDTQVQLHERAVARARRKER